MQIKPLEWKLKASGGELAHSLIGMFTIEKIEGGFVYTHHTNSGETKGCRASIQEARDRCAEIVEEAIRGALVDAK